LFCNGISSSEAHSIHGTRVYLSIKRFWSAAELTPEAVGAIAEQVRVLVLRWFARSGLTEPDDVREMLAWENSGFSLDAAVRVGAHDRGHSSRAAGHRGKTP
jgi:hypothetical protein